MVAARREHGDVAIVEVHDGPRVLEDRGGVGGDEIFAVADAQQHGRSLPRHDDLLGIVGGDDRQAVRADHVLERRDHARLERVARRVLDQVGERLRVRLGPERVAGPFECGAQRIGVLDDAVVHEGEALATVRVRVRVTCRRRSVRGPARVRDAAKAGRGLARDQRL